MAWMMRSCVLGILLAAVMVAAEPTDISRPGGDPGGDSVPSLKSLEGLLTDAVRLALDRAGEVFDQIKGSFEDIDLNDKEALVQKFTRLPCNKLAPVCWLFGVQTAVEECENYVEEACDYDYRRNAGPVADSLSKGMAKRGLLNLCIGVGDLGLLGDSGGLLGGLLGGILGGGAKLLQGLTAPLTNVLGGLLGGEGGLLGGLLGGGEDGGGGLLGGLLGGDKDGGGGLLGGLLGGGSEGDSDGGGSGLLGGLLG